MRDVRPRLAVRRARCADRPARQRSSRGCTIWRAEWMRDFTVPTGMSSSVAMSVYSSSCTSRSTSGSTSAGWSTPQDLQRLEEVEAAAGDHARGARVGGGGQLVGGQLGRAALEGAVRRAGAVGGHGVQPGGEPAAAGEGVDPGRRPAAARPGPPPRRPRGRAASGRRSGVPAAGSRPAATRARAGLPPRRGPPGPPDRRSVSCVSVHPVRPPSPRSLVRHNTDRVSSRSARSPAPGRATRGRRLRLGVALPRRRARVRRRGEGARRQLGAAARHPRPVPAGGADPAAGRLRLRRPGLRRRRGRRHAVLRDVVRRPGHGRATCSSASTRSAARPHRSTWSSQAGAGLAVLHAPGLDPPRHQAGQPAAAQRRRRARG